MTADAPAALLDRVLEASGPVPFAWKEALYARLLPDPARHMAIFHSLLGSRFDVYGEIDPARARVWLAQLHLPPDTPDLATLCEALEGDG